MASGGNAMDIVGAKDVGYESVGGNSPHHNEVRKNNAYQSKETPGWKKIEVPDGQHFQERERSGKDVPMPPVLDLP